MTTPKPRTVQEEIAFLDEVEREMVALTTAKLEVVPALLPFTAEFKTAIPAKAGTHTARDATAKRVGAVTQRGDGSRRTPG
jgi:hypothetical protein